MTNEEMAESLTAVLDLLTLEAEDMARGRIKQVIAALEEKPLAVVEECDLHRYSKSPTMYHLESVFESQEELCEEGLTVLVTATITRKPDA